MSSPSSSLLSPREAATYHHPQTHPCHDISLSLFQCHSIHGKLGEDCLREELLYKKCHAQLHCHREAKAFYHDVAPGAPRQTSLTDIFMSARSRIRKEDGDRGVVSCAMLVERFAFPEHELRIPEGMKVGRECREIVHDLAKCMSRKAAPRRP